MDKIDNIARNKRIIDALRTVIDIPEGVTSLDLSLRMDDAPRVDLCYFSTKPHLGTKIDARSIMDRCESIPKAAKALSKEEAEAMKSAIDAMVGRTVIEYAFARDPIDITTEQDDEPQFINMHINYLTVRVV